MYLLSGDFVVYKFLLKFKLISFHYLLNQVALDPKQFMGLDSVADAVEYLHSGKSVGKVICIFFLC